MLQAINTRTKAGKYFIYFPNSLHALIFGLPLIKRLQRQCFILVLAKTVTDGIFILIIYPAGCLTAQYQALYQFIFLYFQSQHSGNGCVELQQHIIQRFGLWCGSWETIENKSCSTRVGRHKVAHHANHHVIGHQFTLADIFVGSIAQWCSCIALSPQQIAGTDVLQGIFGD